MKIPNMSNIEELKIVSLARIVSEDSQQSIPLSVRTYKSSKDS